MYISFHTPIKGNPLYYYTILFSCTISWYLVIFFQVIINGKQSKGRYIAP